MLAHEVEGQSYHAEERDSRRQEDERPVQDQRMIEGFDFLLELFNVHRVTNHVIRITQDHECIVELAVQVHRELRIAFSHSRVTAFLKENGYSCRLQETNRVPSRFVALKCSDSTHGGGY